MEWNVIVSVNEKGYQVARQWLREYGKIKASDFFNVLMMWVDDRDEFLEDMRTLYEMHTPQLESIGRIVPVTHRFTFQTAEAFEVQAREVVSLWLDDLAGKHFYVRMHRRGFKGRLSSLEEECFLDKYILEELRSKGKAAAKVDFSGAERVIAVEMLGQQAGLSLWTAEQMERYPFLKLK